MSNDSTTTTASKSGSMPDADAPMHMMRDTLDKFLDSASVKAVYGEPIAHGEMLVVPSAEVLAAMGFGVGYGSGSATEKETGKPSEGYGGGGGGGGRVLSRPVAAIIIKPNRVIVQPIVDVTKLGLAALTAVGFMAGAMLTMGNRRRAMKALKGE